MWWVYRAIDALFVVPIALKEAPAHLQSDKWTAVLLMFLLAETVNAVIRYAIRRYVPVSGTVLPPERSPTPAASTLGPSAPYIDQEGCEIAPPRAYPARSEP